MKIDKSIFTSDTAKYIYIGAGVLLAIILIVWIIKKLRKDPDEESHNKIIKNIDKSKLTYDDEQYEIWANALEVAFQDKSITSGFLGVDEDSIYSIMEEMKNNEDVKQLIDSFGTRLMRKEFDISSNNFTLEQAMSYFLSARELNKVNQILESNNVTLKFK